MWVHIKVHNKDANFGLWLPLVLLYPIVLAILLILSPFILLALIIIWLCGRGNWALFTLKTIWVAFCSLHGFKVDVQNPHDTVFISIV
jgi:hypothetical protein